MARSARKGSIGRRAAIGTAAVLGAGAIAAGSADAADFQVTNVNDAGPGSLRQALEDSNGSAGADTVSFATGLSGRIELNSGSGSLPVRDAVEINGPGAGVVTVDGNGNFSVFDVSNLAVADQAVTISGLKIVDGEASYGGGIYNAPNGGFASELTVTDSVITGNRASEYGGGIYSDEGSLTVRDSSISRNSVGDGSGNDYGGGVMVQTTDGDSPVDVLITDSKLNKNSAYGDGGAAYFESVANDTVVRRTTVSDNASQEDGGGMVFCDDGSGGNSAVIEDSTFSGNTATSGAGGVWLLCASETETITNSTFTDNFAGYSGGGIYDDTDAPLTVRNTTVTGNEANDYGGGIFANQGPTTITISSSIVSGNAAGRGPDIADLDGDEAFIAGNSLIGTTAGVTDFTENPAGTNKIGADPQLGPLVDNGGPTKTMLPAISSPAIDAGVANGLAADQRGEPRTVIQPTVPLSAGSDGTDIGAVELAAVPAPDTKVDGAKLKSKKKQLIRKPQVFIKIRAGAAEAVTMKATGKITLGKKKIALKSLTKKGIPDKLRIFKLKTKKKSANKKIVKALANGKKGKAKVTVKFTDDAGNTAKKKATIKLKGAKSKTK